ncbi:hypothetical protein ABT237_22905 [Streptomyces sp. NPDC001581]|uniref:hypothetical protein n=1 Tax=Streptomyces sp. NPDC001581 TaxID=3154386 RepID=UPI00332FEF39
MSLDLHTPPAGRSKRLISRFVMAATSAALISGAKALPASAATTPSVRPTTANILTGDDTVEYGGDGTPQPGDLPGEGGDTTVTYGGDSSTYYGVGTFANFGDDHAFPEVFRQGASGGQNYDPKNPHRSGAGGAYGSETCEQGYVWRGSYDGDSLCVTPAERDAAQNQ